MTVNVCQIALSVSNADASIRFYQELFGMNYVFSSLAFRGRGAEKIQGIPGAASRVSWLIDDRAFFQLELFQFETPVSAPFGDPFDANRAGYRRLIFQVDSIIAFAQRAHQLGYAMLEQVPPNAPPSSYFMVDPDGIPIELVEDVSLVDAHHACKLVGLGMTVPECAKTTEAFVRGMGFERWPSAMAQADGNTARLVKGDVWLDIVQPNEGAAWPQSYGLHDIGIMNLALGFSTLEEFSTCFDRALAHGFVPNSKPFGKDRLMCCVYMNDPQKFSVEMLFCTPAMYGLVGFKKPGLLAKWQNKRQEIAAFKNTARRGYSSARRRQGVFSKEIRTELRIDAPAEKVWASLMDFSSYPEWNPMLEIHEIDRRKGGAVKFSVKLGKTKTVSFAATITQDERGRRFAWRGGNPLAVTGEHYFELTEDGDGTTTFMHGERFSGLLLPLAWKRIAKSERLYLRMAEALKHRVSQ